jgi:signal transduction histidine kinase
MLLLVIVATVFVIMLISNRVILRRVRQRMSHSRRMSQIMEDALEISHNDVVRYDLHDRHIYTLYGTLFPQQGLSLDDWEAHVHPDDLETILVRFHNIISRKEARAEFYYRWNFNFTGKTPRWGYLHNVSVGEFLPGMARPISIISTLRDDTDLRQAEQEESDLSENYHIIFENSIIGLSFYSPDGWLLHSNKMMREICHFDSNEFDAYFSQTNLFDDSPFRECCNPDNLEELWICHQSVVPERGIHDYLETRLHPIRDDQGKLIYIAIATRNITEERELYLQAKLNDIEIQKANELIKSYEAELNYMMENCDMQAWRISFDKNTIEYYRGLNTVAFSCSLEEMQNQFVEQDDPVVKSISNPREFFLKPVTWIGKVHSVFSHADHDAWVQINSVPEYDDDGQQIGCFGIWRNITKLMSKQEQLKAETERAQNSVRQKSVFLANMTHEIRTPLNAIVGFTDLLQAIESPDDKKEMVRVIHNNCDMLLRLINDILLLSTADANTMEIVPCDVDAAHDFEQNSQTLAQRVQNPGVQFIVENPYEVCRTRLDSARMHQVLTNFVTNAVKYTQQGHIKVGYRIEERNGQNGLYAYCEDTGTGIPKDKQAAVFERFVKLNDYIQGTGLGLSICKTIIERCGGQIGVDSEEGKGSTFWFWIPANITEVKEKTVHSL